MDHKLRKTGAAVVRVATVPHWEKKKEKTPRNFRQQSAATGEGRGGERGRENKQREKEKQAGKQTQQSRRLMFMNCVMEKSAASDACLPSLPSIPIPTFAACGPLFAFYFNATTQRDTTNLHRDRERERDGQETCTRTRTEQTTTDEEEEEREKRRRKGKRKRKRRQKPPGSWPHRCHHLPRHRCACPCVDG